MILRRQGRSLFITTAALTYFSINSVFAEEKTLLKNLRCKVGQAQMLDEWLWARGNNLPTSEDAAFKVFEIRDFHTKQPELFDPKFKTLRPLKVIRRTKTVELFNFQSYNYTENFEYYINDGKIEYTQIFRDVGSHAQFYVANGSCEILQP